MTNSKAYSVIRKIIYAIVIILAVIAVFVGVYAYSLINSPNYITVGVGESYTLDVKQDDYAVRSYEASVITPLQGSTVMAHEVGDAVVGVKYSYFDRDFYRFVVIPAPERIKLNSYSVHLGKGESTKISGSCVNGSHEFTLTYSSNNTEVASVDNEGNITAHSGGKCKVHAKAYNNINAICDVIVSEAPVSFSLNAESLTLGKGETYLLEPVFNENEYSNEVTYTSSDETVAQILNKNELCAVSEGTCTITATTFNNKTAECTVTVKKAATEVSLIAPQKCRVGTDVRLIVSIPDGYASNEQEIIVSDPTILEIDKNDKTLLHAIKKGTATVTVKLANGVSDSVDITVDNYKKASIDFDIINQFPTLPTGCELVSLTSVLNHYGFDVSATKMADKYMPKKEHDYFNVSPHDYFLGTPYSYDNGMGCFSGCIVKTAENYFKDKNITDYVALDITGCKTEELFNYLQNGVPVITWATSSFSYPVIDGVWYVNGEKITWYEREHCLVTTGYNEKDKTVTIADDAGGYTYTVSLSQFKNVFEGTGSMAVVILKK